MFTLSLDRTIDLSTGAFVGLLSVSGLMSSYRCPRQHSNVCASSSNSSSTSDSCNTTDMSNCPISPCSRTNLRLAVGAGFVTSGLYLYRGLR